MKTEALIKVRTLFSCGIKEIDRHNRRAWVKSVRFLGEKWLLHPANRVLR